MTIITSNDLVEEIIKYLPARSLARFKCVSKHWMSVIQPDFKFLVVHQPPSKVDEDSNAKTLLLETFSKSYDNEEHIRRSLFSSCTIPGHSVNEFKPHSIRVLGSCDGLVVIIIYGSFFSIRTNGFKYIYLINPKTMEQRTLCAASLNMTENQQGSKSILPFAAGFGKDIIKGSYKVILMYMFKRVPHDITVKVMVLCLHNGEQTDAGEFPIYFSQLDNKQISVFVNGSLFWLPIPIKERILFPLISPPSKLVAMDLHTEKFRGISLPCCYIKYSPGMCIWSLNDRLCLSDVLQCSDLDVWSLQQEHPREKWEKIFTFNILNIGWFDINFWTLGLVAAFLRKTREGRPSSNQTSLDHLKTTAYTPTLISPYRL